MGGAKSKNQPMLGRLDCLIKCISVDEVSGKFQVELILNPRRYIVVDHEGQPHYRDQHLKTLVSCGYVHSVLAEHLKDLPLYSEGASVGSATGYASERLPAIKHELVSGQHLTSSADTKPHRAFEQNNRQGVAFVSVDICGSTTMRQRAPDSFDKSFKIFFQEMAVVAAAFQGTVDKVTGDGFIAYIDHPAFCIQGDQVIDMGLTFLVVLRDAINPALVSAGLEPLKIRVGADFGPAKIQEMNVAATGFRSQEVASDALNRAVKIERACDANQFLIGQRLYEIAHVRWLERSTEVPFEGKSVGMNEYKVYQVR